MKIGIAGSVESNDTLITVEEYSSMNNEIIIDSIVDDFFHDQIYQVIDQTLKERNVNNVKVTVQDKGALDYTIKARLITALERMEKNNA